MFVIIGFIVVTGCVLGGYTWAGGHVEALIHPSEVLTIGGASLGAMLVMGSPKILKDLIKSIIGALKGSPFNKKAYGDLFKLSYDLLKTARKDGLLALEPHLNDPHESKIFSKYPRLQKDHHFTTFLCDGLSSVVEASMSQEQLHDLLQKQIAVMEEEHHQAVGILAKSADAMPGFGIVAAVLGIVITMGAIDGPVEEIGHKVGAALVGTFLGILASYGFMAPLAARMDLLGKSEMDFYRTTAAIIEAAIGGAAPKQIIEQARRVVCSEARPERVELEKMLKEADAAA
ncbi:MotA/TolQ/ExbB proton channel [Planctopirus limnophila DSM 3776]|uniref:MotA/TolQ/ExbB proton channel n=1 Tax=Planctopirus limnophila (strain ATCC 43296 / DSM 3776 / IFAM 1008 / Mu 290) TaxID=521674 RepID=D5SQ33_PLAL2|nr:flagellar motor stator protein MotA [Planctopirus limnophila]ADG68408.1 MotA/TolQ/ExbB proton channel [Planctopirus limnophila DSM 3776]